MNEHSKTMKSFLGVVLLNALLAYPVVYLIYKHFSPLLTPMDIQRYMVMVDQGFGAAEPPFRYRYLLPLVIRAVRFLPGYGIPIIFSDDPVVKRDFFHFLMLNFGMTVLVSGMIFLYLKDKVRLGFAYLGSVLYLFSFYPVLLGIIPMTDAICHLAIISCILLMEKEKPIGFTLVCLIGVFAKETLLVVLFPWILIQALSHRRRLLYAVYAAPAALAYIIATRLDPAPSSAGYYHPTFLIANAFNVFRPGLYDRSLLFHIFFSHVPLLVCLAIFLWFKGIRRAEAPVFNPELWLFFLFIWLGFTLGIDNNTGRVAFMAFPAVILFEARVLQAVADRLGCSEAARLN
jgi:hypothetical protein